MTIEAGLHAHGLEKQTKKKINGATMKIICCFILLNYDADDVT